MKAAGIVAIALGACRAMAENPLGTVLKLIDELEAKVVKEGEAEAKAYAEYVEWCDDTASSGKQAVKTATTQKEKLEAKIGELTSSIDVSSSKIEELGAAIAQADSELKNATLIREKEVAEFKSSEAELMDAVDTLSRAIGVLEKEMAKNPAALAQVDSSNMAGALQALSAVLDGAGFLARDQKKLAAFVQARQGDEDLELQPGAPAAATYETHSGGILDVLEDMKEKAESELADLRKAETNTAHNYDMLKQSLSDQIKADTKDMDDEKANKAAAEESKATAEADLASTIKELESSQSALATAQKTCMQVATDHEESMAGRNEELKVLAEAEKILKETSEGAVSQTYSLLQVASSARMASRADLARSEVLAMVKRLAKEHRSAALAQLASRISAAIRMGAGSRDDPFGKVKGLIEDMIAKLTKELADETDEKAYCDEQMSKTEEKKAELEEDVAKLTSKIDQAVAKSAELKEEVAELQSQLAALAKEQAELDKIRQETHADYVQAKEDLTLGLGGVRKALQVLREHYAAGASAALLQNEAQFGASVEQPAMPEKHSSATGAGQGIIGILEVCESDFATNLAKEEQEESDAQEEYEKVSQENALAKTNKEQDVKYKTKESKSLDKAVAEMSSDRETIQTELNAVLEYYAKIKDRCIAKPETYEERKRRREAEIQGLKEALSVLENETALLQRKRRGGLRGASALQAN